MIFVTVGTHEQPFNRLIQKVDELKRDGIIKDEVIIQTGFSTWRLIGFIHCVRFALKRTEQKPFCLHLV